MASSIKKHVLVLPSCGVTVFCSLKDFLKGSNLEEGKIFILILDFTTSRSMRNKFLLVYKLFSVILI